MGLIRTVLLTLGVCTALLAQTQTFDDNGKPNGRFWRGMNHKEKVYYLTGLSAGINIARFIAADDTPRMVAVINEAIPDGFSLGDYERELDLLYNDTENVLINLHIAWLHCINKFKGTWTKQELEQQLVKLRQTAKFNYKKQQ